MAILRPTIDSYCSLTGQISGSDLLLPSVLDFSLAGGIRANFDDDPATPDAFAEAVTVFLSDDPGGGLIIGIVNGVGAAAFAVADFVASPAGIDHVIGTGGNDTFAGSTTRGITFEGAEGDDAFQVSPSRGDPNTFAGGDGVDSLSVTFGAVEVRLELRPGFVHGIEFLGRVDRFDFVSDIEKFFGGDQLDQVLRTGASGDFTAELQGGNDIYLGSEDVEVVFGGDGMDCLRGGSGDDLLDGGTGDDRLRGADGSDTLIARGGNDILDGGSGGNTIDLDDLDAASRDIVQYHAIQESGPRAPARDEIRSFDVGGLATDDVIDLSAIDANPRLRGDQAFAFVSSFTATPGEVRVSGSGSGTLVSVNIDIDLAAEMTIEVAGVTGLTEADFIL